MDKTDYLLVCLIEEAAEVQKCATKALRFGLDNHHPNSFETNREQLSKECGELCAVVAMLDDNDTLKILIESDAYNDKPAKISKYMQVSKDCGKLEKDEK